MKMKKKKERIKVLVVMFGLVLLTLSPMLGSAGDTTVIEELDSFEDEDMNEYETYHSPSSSDSTGSFNFNSSITVSGSYSLAPQTTTHNFHTVNYHPQYHLMADCDLQIYFQVTSNYNDSEWAEAGIVARGQGNYGDNYRGFYHGMDDTLNINKFVGGSKTNLASVSGNFTDGYWYKLQFSIDGDELQLTCVDDNGTLEISATDSTFSEGDWGILSGVGQDQPVDTDVILFDNFGAEEYRYIPEDENVKVLSNEAYLETGDQGDIRGSSTRDQYSGGYHYKGEKNRTYFAWISNENNGNIYVGCYDHQTGEVSTTLVETPEHYPSDVKHANPSIIVDKKGYIHVFLGAHNNPIQYGRSTNPENISNFESMSTIGQENTYFYPVLMNDGSIWLFTRHYDNTEEDYKFGYYSTKDNSTPIGDEWNDFRAVYDYSENSEKLYMSIEKSGDYLHCVVASRKDTVEIKYSNTYYMKYRMESNTWSDASGNEGILPFDEEDCDMVNHYEEEWGFHPKTVHGDSQGNPIVGYFGPTKNVTGNATYWVSYYDGSSWNRSNKIDLSPNEGNFGEFIKVSDNCFDYYLTNSTNPTREGGNIEIWRTIDHGDTWSLRERITTDGESQARHFYPNTITNASTVKCFWTYGIPTEEGGDKTSMVFYSEITPQPDSPLMKTMSGVTEVIMGIVPIIIIIFVLRVVMSAVGSLGDDLI